MVRALLTAPGVDVELEDAFSYTPLAIAAKHNHVECMKLLLGVGVAGGDDSGSSHGPALVDGTPGSRKTALRSASRDGHAAAVSVLLTAKAGVNGTSPMDGTSALTIAARFGHSAVIHQLVAAKADVDYTPFEGCGNSALFCAALRGYTGVLRVLIFDGEARVDAVSGSSGYTPLCIAAQMGNVGAVKVLLHHGYAGANVRTADGLSLIHI